MHIIWEPRLLGFEEPDVGCVAKILHPYLEGRWLQVALAKPNGDGKYMTSFLFAIREHFDIPKRPLKTETAARKRIRKYVELWAIAGYPRGEQT